MSKLHLRLCLAEYVVSFIPQVCCTLWSMSHLEELPTICYWYRKSASELHKCLNTDGFRAALERIGLLLALLVKSYNFPASQLPKGKTKKSNQKRPARRCLKMSIVIQTDTSIGIESPLKRKAIGGWTSQFFPNSSTKPCILLNTSRIQFLFNVWRL